MTALCPAAQAVAQEDDDDGFGLEEIIVTATRRSMSVQDVPQSIIAFSTAEIERRAMLDVADVAVNLPSITLTTDRAGRNALVYRGISTGISTSSWYLDSQVAMYLDEMPMTMSTTQLDPRMVDINRVESLPGPQGTLFGSSSQGGTLRVVTNKPDPSGFSAEISTELKFTQGGEESYDFNGWVNIPVSDNFAVRVVGYSVKEGGYIDNVFATAPHSVCAAGADCDHNFDVYDIGPFDPNETDGHLSSPIQDNAGREEDDFNDYEIVGGRISALWNINEDWEALLTVMSQHSETTGVWFSDTAMGDYKVARFSDDWRKDEWTAGQLTITGDLGFAELTNSFGYADRVQTYQFDNTHYEAWHTRWIGNFVSAWRNWYNVYWGLPSYAYNYYDKYDTGYNGGWITSYQDSERLTNELRLTSTTDSRFQWMVGAFYENFKDGWQDDGVIPNLTSTKAWDYSQWRSCFLQGFGYPTACPLEAASDPRTSNSWYHQIFTRDRSQIAVFGEMNYEIVQNLDFTLGARWFEFDRYTVFDRQWPPGLVLEAILLSGETTSIQDGKEDDTTYKVGLNYNLSDDKMIYSLYSEGFRLGGRNNPRAVAEGFVPEFYKPDKLNNYELGMKTEWLNGRLLVNGAVFFMDWEDIQMYFSSDQLGLHWLNGQANGGGGENLGVELDILFQATESLQLSFSGYTGDPEYTADYINDEGTQLLTKGSKMPNSARHKITVAADYRIPNALFGGDVWARYDYYWQSEQFSALWRVEAANPNSPDYVEGSTYDVDSFHKSNFQIGWERDSWSAKLIARNLTNERANTFTGTGVSFYAGYWGHTGYGETHNLARPRTVSLKLTKRFD